MRSLMMLGLLLSSSPAWAECTDTATNDCDGDGYRAADGDCDDEDPEVNPAAHDGCDNFDNDCDQLIDENCVDTAGPGLTDATLGGGTSCAPTSGSLAWLLILPVFGLGRRRR